MPCQPIEVQRDKTVERVTKLAKGKVTRRIKMVEEWHQSSLLLNFADVEQGNKGEWKDKSCKNTYTVKLAEEECTGHNCVERCIDCNICLHRYVCTCTDILLYCVMCKHIHLVGSLNSYKLVLSSGLLINKHII